MPTPRIVAGSVILIPGTGSAKGKDKGHDFIVLTDPDKDGDVLIVPICTHHSACDKTVEFQPNETGVIGLTKTKSYVAYYQGKKYDKKRIDIRIQQAEITFRGKVSDAFLKRVLDGIFKSEEVEGWFEDAYKRAAKK